MDSISKKFLIMDNLAKAMEPLDTRVQGMVQHSTSTIFLILKSATIIQYTIKGRFMSR